MNLKKGLFTVVTLVLSLGAFAYPSTPDDDPTAQLLEQYTAQVQEMQKAFDTQILPTLKSTAQLALQIQQAGQTEITEQQEQLFNKYAVQLDSALTKMVAPALKEVDLAQFNEQYKQTAQTYGLPEQEFTLPEVTEMLKGMYLVSSLAYFEQTKKLAQDELTVLMEIFFPAQEEETEE